MSAQRQPGCRAIRFIIVSWLTLVAAFIAASAVGQPLFGSNLVCSPTAPPGQPVGQGLLNNLQGPLNAGWQGTVAPKISKNTFDLERVHLDTQPSAGCTSDVTKFCEGHLAFSHCSFVYVNLKMQALAGLENLRFTALNVPAANDRNVAAHTNPGPDASVITDGVFAPNDWNAADPAYVVVLPHNSKQGAIVIDLGEQMSLCGVATGCTAPTIQADNDDTYHLDYSVNGSTWSTLGTFSTPSHSGLQTRALSGSGFPTNFSARYVAVYATGSGNTFSVSELQLFDTTNKLVSVGKPAVGPIPYEIVDGFIPASKTSAADSTVSVVLTHKTGPATALNVYLGDSAVSICGRSKSDCLHEPTISADNDDIYMLDYSQDGKNWTTYGSYDSTGEWHSATFGKVAPNDSGLWVRDMACSARPDLTTACSASNQGADFSARFLRVYARGGGNTFAVAALELWDSAGNRLPTTPTFASPEQYAVGGYTPYAAGPEPLYINGEFAPEGTTSWSDPTYATKLGACSVAANQCPPVAQGAAQPITAAKVIDLTATFPISRLVIQAESNNHYQVDGWDGVSKTSSGAPAWTPLWTVPPVSGNSNLRTRKTTFATPYKEARYVRVYATSGNGNYSVSELQVFTPQANTAGTYAGATGAVDPSTGAPLPQLDSQGFPWSDGRANDARSFACSYDGTFDTTLGVVGNPGETVAPFTATGLPITYTVDNAELWAHCVTDTDSGDYRIAAATNRDCGMTLIPPTGYGQPFTDAWQAGQCQSPANRQILSYMRFDDNTNELDNSAIQFISKDQPPNANPNPSDLQCNDMASLDAHIPAVLRGFVPAIATEAVRQGLNALLDYHNSPFSLVPFPVVSTGQQPPQPTTVPLQCDDSLVAEPPTPKPDNARVISGRATQVGSGSDSATLRITGSFAVNEPVALDRAGLAVYSLLQEIGLGERVEGPDGGQLLLPIGLEAQNGSKPNKGMYKTSPAAKPMVSARIDAQGSSMSYEIDVQRVTIAEPEACRKGLPTARVKTEFVLVGGSANAVEVRGTSEWQCKGAQLATP
jgi:hypothetical protein